MKKLLFTILFGILLTLVACSGNESEQSTETSDTTQESVETSGDSVTFAEASVGDVVTDDYGSYEIVKVSEDVGSYETGGIKFDVPKVFLATFTPIEGEEFYFDEELGEDGSLNLAVSLVNAENTGEEYVTFSPFSAEVFVEGSKPYRGQAYLNVGDSEISAGDTQEFTTAHYLEDEDLASITELKVVQSAPSSDSMSIGEDVEFTVTFE